MRAAASRDVRRHNLSLVLGEVARSPRSRAALAGETGLNKSTVSSLVAELCDLGFLRDSGQGRSGAVGRPAQNVELDPEGPFVLGLEINVDYLGVWATDLGGGVLHRTFTANDNRDEPEGVAARLEQLARHALDEPFARGREPVASAVAVPGIVGHRGEIVVAPNLYWEDVPLAGMLSHELGPLSVENEANLGALAELSEGAGREFADFVYLSAEVGIGAGIVLEGELFRGAHGFGGEIGHLTIDPSGPPCPCGSRGCLERLAGQDALLRLAGWDARTGGPGPRPEWPGAMLAESARAGQPRTLEALSQVGHTLGIAAAAVVNLLNPQALLLGGYFAPVTPWLREPIEAELHRRLPAGNGAGCHVLQARLSGEAAVRGAAALARQQVLADPLAYEARALAGARLSPCS
jgi:predicted NBD/HSP70 family sugar kinase